MSSNECEEANEWAHWSIMFLSFLSTDVNECELLSSVCGEAECMNVDASFLCVCPSGQEYNAMIAKCEPIPTGDPPLHWHHCAQLLSLHHFIIVRFIFLLFLKRTSTLLALMHDCTHDMMRSRPDWTVFYINSWIVFFWQRLMEENLIRKPLKPS